MNMFQPVAQPSDRVMAALVAGLEIEFGRGAAEGLARRFLDAEECDFHLEARSCERWLGRYEASGEDDLELDRVGVLGRLDGGWFTAICIVDGNGNAHGMTGCRSFNTRHAAHAAFVGAR
jgi:hypothetical protein